MPPIQSRLPVVAAAALCSSFIALVNVSGAKIPDSDCRGNPQENDCLAAPTPDTAAPTVNLTNPVSGSNVSAQINVTASASDNVAIVGVKFKLDGADLGAEDTTAPYSTTWDTTKTSNGSHSLAVTARDAAGNATTSSSTTTVSNPTTAAPPPTTTTTTTTTTTPTTPTTTTTTTTTTPVSVTQRVSALEWTQATNGWGPVERDLSNGEKLAGDGRTLTLNGVTYAKGLGVHAASDVRFAISGCSRFKASVGVDDEVAANGSVVFQVFADATKVFDSGVMSGATATSQVDVSVVGATLLRLVVTDGGNGVTSDHGDWADARIECTSAMTAAPPTTTTTPTTPTTALPFAEAQMRTGYVTLTVPTAQNTIKCPQGVDCLIDLQNTKRPGSLLIYGYAGSNIKVIKGYWDVAKSFSDGGPYWRGGPRVRSSDGVGPDHVSLTDMLITGPTLADGIGIDAGTNTKVTIQRTRIESASLVTGQNSTEPNEHLDALQVQGKLRELNLGRVTLYAASVAAGNHGGKAFMLGGSVVGNINGYAVNMNQVNMRAPGSSTGCVFVQDQRNITVTMTDVWALKDGAGQFLWSSGSGLFLAYQSPTQWTSSGTAPSRVANFPAGLGFNGVIHEGIPGGQDYVTRATLGF